MSDALKLFHTPTGWIVETVDGHFRVPPSDSHGLTAHEDLHEMLAAGVPAFESAGRAALDHLLPPVEQQEVWAAGVTYFSSRTARMEESKVSAGSHFYDLVYNADCVRNSSSRPRPGGSSAPADRSASAATRRGTCPSRSSRSW